jgi:hypothetical protein
MNKKQSLVEFHNSLVEFQNKLLGFGYTVEFANNPLDNGYDLRAKYKMRKYLIKLFIHENKEVFELEDKELSNLLLSAQKEKHVPVVVFFNLTYKS